MADLKMGNGVSMRIWQGFWEDLVSVYQKDSALLIELLCLGGVTKPDRI